MSWQKLTVCLDSPYSWQKLTVWSSRKGSEPIQTVKSCHFLSRRSEIETNRRFLPRVDVAARLRKRAWRRTEGPRPLLVCPGSPWRLTRWPLVPPCPKSPQCRTKSRGKWAFVAPAAARSIGGLAFAQVRSPRMVPDVGAGCLGPPARVSFRRKSPTLRLFWPAGFRVLPVGTASAGA